MVSTEATVSAPTEDRHPGTTGIDGLSTLEMLPAQRRGRHGPGRGAGVLPALAALVDAAVAAVGAGATIHYVGAGRPGGSPSSTRPS